MQIFISYSRPDEAAARKLHGELKARNCKPWLDKEMLLPGQRWRTEIVKAIKSSDFATVLFSNASLVRDGFYQREIRTCLDVIQDKASGKVWLLPIRLDDCNVPNEIEEYQYVDLFPEWAQGVNRLLRSIGEQAEIKVKVAGQLADILNEDLSGSKADLVPVKELAEFLELKGYRRAPQTSGSHEIWLKQTLTAGNDLIVVPKAASPTIANQILRRAGVKPQF